MQPKRYFGQVSHIPSQRSGFVGLLQDLIHISSLQKPDKIPEPVLSPSEESRVADEARKGNKTAQEKLVDHYDTLAANAFLKADSAKDEEERRKYRRQWCFYASRAEEIDCPASAKDVRRLERLFYIAYPPKEAKRINSIQKEKISKRFSTFIQSFLVTGMGAFLVWSQSDGQQQGFLPALVIIVGTIWFIWGIVSMLKAIGGKSKDKKLYVCGNCGDEVELSSYTCPTCKTRLKD
jgi:hypothetical protein